MKRLFAALCLLPFLAACGGNASTPGTLLPPAQLAPQAVSQIEEQSDATRATLPLSVASAQDLLYVGNTANNSITVYRTDAAADAAPLYVIAGSKTGLSSPGQLSQDAQGNLYVANGSSVLVFAHGANGNVAPIRKLSGTLTGIHTAGALTVDQTTGKIFVVDGVPNGNGAASLLRFPPNATGNTAPFARSAPNLYYPIELASDSSGRNVIEANAGQCCNAQTFGIDTFVKQFPNAATIGPVFAIRSFDVYGLADDPASKTYVTTTSAGIYRLAENTGGNGPNGPNPTKFTPAPISLITSDRCGSQLAIGFLQNIFVTHGTQSGCPTDAVYVYARDASGNAAPLRVLGGAATKLSHPYGIYEGK